MVPAWRPHHFALPTGRRTLHGLRTTLIGAVVTALAGLGMVAVAAPAQAEAYAYWGFHQWSDNSWTAAAKGPGQVVPDDGTVEGWRYAVSGSSTPPRTPRTAGDFETICGSTKRPAGTKRVAVVIDFGLGKEAPKGQHPTAARGACSVVPSEASSADALAEVGEVRNDDQGMVCGVDGYPRTGCSEPAEADPDVASPEPTVDLKLPDSEGSGDSQGSNSNGSADAADEHNTENAAKDSGPSTSTIVGVFGVALIVLGLVFAAVRRSRQRRDTGQ